MNSYDEIKIEKDIPAPTGIREKYQLRRLEVGDSVLYPLSVGDKLRKAAHAHGLRHNRQYVTRTFDDGVRVWRVK